jgi:oxalate decarboxylase/phosphoglucose isomerase-like protein (cupin superfamily)
MKIFKFEDYINMENPDPGQIFRPEILTAKQGAKDLGGILGLLPPGKQVPYHYHKNRESIIIGISGKALEVIEEKEFSFEAGTIFYIAVGEKHMTINRSNQDFRYLEFYTCPPLSADFVEVTDEVIK